MTQHMLAPTSARSRNNAAVLNLRIAQRRNSDHQARRRLLMSEDPAAAAEQLRQRLEDLAARIERTRGES